jgi:pyridoxal phosphate enzyme (YggS family)
MRELSSRLVAVQTRIAAATAAAGRPPGAVRLLAVSKTRPAADVRALFEAGQRAFGENYVQEAEAKMAQLADLGIEWHHIGRIQGNKTRAIAERFQWAHGVTDEQQARRLSRHRPADLPPLDVCIQVNVSSEATKAGVAVPTLEPLARAVAALPNLRLRGLMAIPGPCADPLAQRLPFRALRELSDRLRASGLELDTLSMGMSDDLEAAILEGATLVRVGTALFGPRAPAPPR